MKIREIKKAVVTGGTGMIGATLIRVLLAQGIQVLALIHPGSRKQKNLPEHPLLTVEELDMSGWGMYRTKEHYDAFFHLAWSGTYGKDRDDCSLQNANVAAALEAVSLAAACGCQIFVGAGSQAEYGRCSSCIGPETPAHPETGYGIGKLSAGLFTRKAAESLGMEQIWIRIFSVYGPFDNPYTMVMSGIETLLNGGIPSYTAGEQLWDYLYSEDAAAAIYLAAERGRSGQVYCLGSGMVRPLKEYILAIRDAAAPEQEIRLGAIPYPDGQVMHLQADITSLKEDTGFEPAVSFEEGIAKTVEWYKKMRNA